MTASGSTTTTVYVGDLEQVTTTGATTTTTAYYYAGSQLIAEAVNGTLSYLASDGLGSVTEALSASGTVQATQLYAPYGLSRYSSGTMPTDYGYTGQRADASTGLDYYLARYYDPVAGQFTSADTMLDGLNRYAYVGGNPTSATDPSGDYSIAGLPEGRGLGWADMAAATATAIVIVAAADAIISHVTHSVHDALDPLAISNPVTDTTSTGSGQQAAVTRANIGSTASGPLPMRPGDPLATYSVNVSAITAWYAALLASLHVVTATTVTTTWWVLPTWYLAKGSSNVQPPSPGDLTDAGTSTVDGGRGGQAIPLEGDPKSYVRSRSGTHIWVYDDEGKLQWDISKGRAKHFPWNTNPKTGKRYPRDGDKVETPPEWIGYFD